MSQYNEEIKIEGFEKCVKSRITNLDMNWRGSLDWFTRRNERSNANEFAHRLELLSLFGCEFARLSNTHPQPDLNRLVSMTKATLANCETLKLESSQQIAKKGTEAYKAISKAIVEAKAEIQAFAIDKAFLEIQKQIANEKI
jgi:hypothetical protein